MVYLDPMPSLGRFRPFLDGSVAIEAIILVRLVFDIDADIKLSLREAGEFLVRLERNFRPIDSCVYLWPRLPVGGPHLLKNGLVLAAPLRLLRRLLLCFREFF